MTEMIGDYGDIFLTSIKQLVWEIWYKNVKKGFLYSLCVEHGYAGQTIARNVSELFGISWQNTCTDLDIHCDIFTIWLCFYAMNLYIIICSTTSQLVNKISYILFHIIG